MSLLAQVQSAVELAFSAAGDLVGEFWLTRQQTASYDGATGDVTTIEVEFKFEGVVGETMLSGAFDSSSSTTGSEVDSTTQKVFLKPADTDPVVGDVLRVGDKRHRVMKVEPIQPDGETVVLWELRVAV